MRPHGRSRLRLAYAYGEKPEYSNLQLAQTEAAKNIDVAGSHVEVAAASLTVATLQKSTAILRHEFAVQNLKFMQERTLNSEMWYRLTGLIRVVRDTYLRRAVELAFLAEQAYEFEVDKRVNVIRFDYDADPAAGLLAADFLLADLDSLEHDLITSQRSRQQQVRYVVSLAREFPAALEQLRANGTTWVTLSLSQLEHRFPGLYNLRIGSVDLSPVALMDNSRFSVELTYMGASQVRLKGLPDVGVVGSYGYTRPPASTTLTYVWSWLATIDPETDLFYPVAVRVNGPETAFFSGMTKNGWDGTLEFYSANQRGAFENLGDQRQLELCTDDN